MLTLWTKVHKLMFVAFFIAFSITQFEFHIFN